MNFDPIKQTKQFIYLTVIIAVIEYIILIYGFYYIGKIIYEIL